MFVRPAKAFLIAWLAIEAQKSPETKIRFRADDTQIKLIRIFSSFIQTILSVLEFRQIMRFHARGLYRRSGISPCPEDHNIQFNTILDVSDAFVKTEIYGTKTIFSFFIFI